MLVKAMLGLDLRDGHVDLDPHLPDELGRLLIRGLRAFGTTWDVETIGTRWHVRLAR
jgi:hypothetical protein